MPTLDKTKENNYYLIGEINVGRRLLNRLSELAIYEGARIKIIRSSFGPILIKVLDSKIAIGRGQAKKIIVHEAANQ